MPLACEPPGPTKWRSRTASLRQPFDRPIRIGGGSVIESAVLSFARELRSVERTEVAEMRAEIRIIIDRLEAAGRSREADDPKTLPRTPPSLPRAEDAVRRSRGTRRPGQPRDPLAAHDQSAHDRFLKKTSRRRHARTSRVGQSRIPTPTGKNKSRPAPGTTSPRTSPRSSQRDEWVTLTGFAQRTAKHGSLVEGAEASTSIPGFLIRPTPIAALKGPSDPPNRGRTAAITCWETSEPCKLKVIAMSPAHRA